MPGLVWLLVGAILQGSTRIVFGATITNDLDPPTDNSKVLEIISSLTLDLRYVTNGSEMLWGSFFEEVLATSHEPRMSDAFVTLYYE